MDELGEELKILLYCLSKNITIKFDPEYMTITKINYETLETYSRSFDFEFISKCKMDLYELCDYFEKEAARSWKN